MSKEIIYRVINLKKYFEVNKIGLLERLLREKPIYVKALDDINLEIYSGEILGIVGESGSGKTTLGRILATLDVPTSGELYFEDDKITKANLSKIRGKVQMVFQNPASSLDPRMKIIDILSEAIRKLPKEERSKLIRNTLEEVGLDYEYVANKYPRELSGGQLQRVAIARAIITSPEFIVLDEPTSALDVSVQAQILNLLVKLQKEKNITYMFITHNISVAKYVSDRIGVLYAGKLVEIGEVEEIISSPKHPYTQSLISSVPSLTKRNLTPPSGEVPSLINPPKGCRFNPRCPYVMEVCRRAEPPLFEIGGRKVACWLLDQRYQKQ
ncbi:ABC transporter ATP-binding protein [Stygiolobus caldivivus]|uniref:Dipeptide/oligopeptide/nickel ABC transporter ATP-binding protein n=1 Tax=Stygiolobus caldivivus TaxID=2824673 RepID=A0A8D5ZK53_9CREN|nr:ABC transporter ATP-binding protein [Stygiolobus caldivivus]BCU71025.1 dipeptide/oligopeptide/nickel ABC transporter ATP-binding protein [Stygiolobus caldivivus]